MINFSIVAFVAFINLILAFFILRNKRSGINLLFAAVIFCIIIWTIANYGADVVSDYTIALILTRATFFAASLIASLFLYFCILFPVPKNKQSIGVILSVFTPGILFAAISFTHYIVPSIVQTPNGVDVNFNSLFLPFALFFLLLMGAAFIVLIKKYRKSIGIERMQIQYLFLGTFLTTLAGLITNLIFPYFSGNSSTSRFGPYFTVFLVAFTTYAIIKHRLLDIVVIIRKVTILGILLMIILGIFSMVAFGLPFVFADSLPEDTFQITLVAVAFIVALFFQPLRRSIEEFTDRWFFKGAYKPQQVIDELSEKISTIIDLRVLLDATAQILLKAFRSEHAVFSVREKIGRAEKDAESAEQKFIAYNTEGRHRPMEEFTYDGKNPFVRYFNKYAGEVIIRDELRKDLEESGSIKHESRNMKHQVKRSGENIDLRLKQAVLKEMANHEFAIIFPVFSKEELVGIFGLGAKKSGDIYAHQDLQILELFSHQVG